jgi:protein phosphatase
VTITTGALTHTGNVRSNNEDHFLVARLAKSMQICQTSLKKSGETRFSDEDGYLLVVADGMGGAAAGERASALAVESVKSFALNTLKWFLHLGKADESVLVSELRQGLELADQVVFDEAESNARFYGMGTTLTMAYSVGRDLYIVHAGDSRAYLFREGSLEQITRDHTLVQLLVSGGVLSPEDAKTHARRNVVTNVIGGPSAGVHAEIHKVRLNDGDVLLLCSDGLTEPVDDRLIA